MILTFLLIAITGIIGQQLIQTCQSWQQRITLITFLLLGFLGYAMTGHYVQEAWHNQLTSQEAKQASIAFENPIVLAQKVMQHCHNNDAKACHLAAGIYLQQNQSKDALTAAKMSYQLQPQRNHLERYALTLIMNQQPMPMAVLEHLNKIAMQRCGY